MMIKSGIKLALKFYRLHFFKNTISSNLIHQCRPKSAEINPRNPHIPPTLVQLTFSTPSMILSKIILSELFLIKFFAKMFFILLCDEVATDVIYLIYEMNLRGTIVFLT